MADRSLINLWLLDAAEDSRSTVNAQVTWLKARRKEYSEKVRGGDWEASSLSEDGASGSLKRGVSDQANHDAIVEALRILGETVVGEKPGIIIPTFGGTLN